MKLVIISLLVLSSSNILAINTVPTGYKVLDGNDVEIDAHGSCFVVTNTSGKDHFVSTKTLGEWSNFQANTPVGLSLVSCASDPCSGKSIGESCSGTTALYAGNFESGQYMVTPSGCSATTSNPICSGGTDTLMKRWNGTSGTSIDISTLSNVSGYGEASLSTERGDVTTPLIVGDSSVDTDSAAEYCQDLDYGGYTDWYLPSKSELAYLFCKSTPSAHDVLYPEMNPNCGGGGASGELSGFNFDDEYWSSTENNSNRGWLINFSTGKEILRAKTFNRLVRCLRRY